MQTYYVIVVNGVPEQVTTLWSAAKAAADQLTSRHREARIVPCVPCPQEDFVDEADTEPDLIVERPNM